MDTLPIVLLVIVSLIILVALAAFFGTVFFAAREAWEFFERENRRARERQE